MKCGNVRKWYGNAAGCVCDLEKGHDPHIRRHTHLDCGLEWGPGNEAYRNKTKARAWHAQHNDGRKQSVMRVLRERAGLSQTELAKIMDRSQPEVSMWEWGKEPMSLPNRLMVTGILRARLNNQYPRLSETNLLRPWDEMILIWTSGEDEETRSTS